jgi:hypothetical protein
LPRGLPVEGDRIAQEFNPGADADIRQPNGVGIAGRDGGRVPCHPGWGADATVDRPERQSLLLSVGRNNLAGHALQAYERCRRGTALAVDDGEFACLKRRYYDRREAGPGEGLGDALDISTSEASDRPLVM